MAGKIEDIADPAFEAALKTARAILRAQRSSGEPATAVIWAIAAGYARALGVLMRLTDGAEATVEARFAAIEQQVRDTYEETDPPPFNVGQFR